MEERLKYENKIELEILESSGVVELLLGKIDYLTSLSKSFLSFDEAMVYTGSARSTLYKLIRERKISYSKPTNGKVYFSKKDLDEFLGRNRVPSNAEIELQANNHIVNKAK